MSEDFGLCTYEKHHKLKIYLLCAMREYKDELESQGFKVYYHSLNDRKKNESYFSFLNDFIKKNNFEEINFFEIEDKPFEKVIINGFKSNSTNYKIHSSPMFMFEKDEFRVFKKNKKVYSFKLFLPIREKSLIFLLKKQKPKGFKVALLMLKKEKYLQAQLSQIIQNFKNLNITMRLLSFKKYFNGPPGQLDEIGFFPCY
ncbi:MAG: hypothetical protein CM15mP110_0050 [Alphaproteobacteria bacterium]|nr:MAG: hypothetical protein CM15mP110_0050 [Alphaproteobacteria bacterium]